jgi:hypothetical protein
MNSAVHPRGRTATSKRYDRAGFIFGHAKAGDDGAGRKRHRRPETGHPDIRLFPQDQVVRALAWLETGK